MLGIMDGMRHRPQNTQEIFNILHFKLMKKLLLTIITVMSSLMCEAQYFPYNPYLDQQAIQNAYEMGRRMREDAIKQHEEQLRQNPIMMRGVAVEEMATGKYQSAYEHYQYLASHHHHGDAWRMLGFMNELGMGTSRDYSYAKTCYSNGIKYGDAHCKKELQRINQGKYLGKEHQENIVRYFEGIYTSGISMTNMMMGNDAYSASQRGNSSSERSNQHSNITCSSCGGTGVSPIPNSGGSLSTWVAHYNSRGNKCPYCGSYTSHFHDKCSSCNVPRY